MDQRLVRAVRANVSWCDAVARASGCVTQHRDGAWTSATRTPPFFPDAITLTPDVDIAAVLDTIDTSSGCSVKDSFATLDLARVGFRPLFDATWLALAVASRADPPARWRRVVDPARLREWQARAGVEGFDALLDDPHCVFAAHDAGPVCAYHRHGDAVGVWHLVTGAEDPHEMWRQCIALAGAWFGPTLLIGYEHGDDLDAALAGGFSCVGPLRVWVCD